MGRHVAVWSVVVMSVAMVAAACGGGDSTESVPLETTADGEVTGLDCSAESPTEPKLLEIGVISELPDNGNDHVLCPSYEQRPPASGDHFGSWQNCGFYSSPVQDQTAVHALEHGAVWISYSPDLAPDQVAAIEARVGGSEHLLAAPYPGLKNPIVLTAWTRQVGLATMADPLFEEFIDTYEARRSPTAPEAGAPCSGQIGSPPDDPDAGFAEIAEQVSG